MGIVFNKDSRKQQHFFHHLDDITSFAIPPNKKLIATGEIGPFPLVCIWDSESMNCISRFTSPLVKGVNCLTFSEDGKLLCGTGADDNHSIVVFDWEKGSHKEQEKGSEVKFKKNRAGEGVNGIFAKGKGTKAVVLNLCFNKANDTIAATSVKVLIYLFL